MEVLSLNHWTTRDVHGFYSDIILSVRLSLATLCEMGTSIPQHLLVPFPALFLSLALVISVF